jgi:hypothetical protein
MSVQIKNALEPYRHDLYGCHAPLAAKRTARNGAARAHAYARPLLPAGSSALARPAGGGFTSSGAAHEAEHTLLAQQGMLAGLLAWCPGSPREDAQAWTRVYEGPLPWDS